MRVLMTKKGTLVPLLLLGALVAVGLSAGLTAANPGEAGLGAAEVLSARDHAAQRAATTMTTSVTAMLQGKPWIAGKYSTGMGETCIEIRSPEGWRSGGCMAAEGGANQKPLDLITGRTPSVTYVIGLVRRDVDHVEVTTRDCVRNTARVADNVLLHVLPNASSKAGPYRVVAEDAVGSVIETVTLPGEQGSGPPSC